MATTLTAAAAALQVEPARGAATWSIKGRGWGHGIGMSQWGAYGQAREGRSYRQILSHYYRGTSLGQAGSRTIRVLIRGGTRRVKFAGVTRVCGRKARSTTTYQATAKGSSVVLRSPRGRALRTCAAPLRATGPRGIVISDRGRYRGALEVRPALFGGLNAINAVGLESYLRGVVPNESPSSWPQEALKAQAVAARSYALATGISGIGFEQYADTRSQVYRGIATEAASANRAIEATRGEVVMHGGETAVSYFFSTSGGRTESIENAWPGSKPRPWLKSVRDPYDRFSPHHRWQLRMSQTSFERRLGSLVKGSFRGIKVIKRGLSPRIVYADVLGSRGKRRVTGGMLRSRLGLRDTWAHFRRISTEKRKPRPEDPKPEPTEQPDPQDGSGGAEPEEGLGSGGAEAGASRRRASFSGSEVPTRPAAALAGSVTPRPSGGRVRLRRRSGSRWETAGWVRLDRKGRYRVAVGRGAYRIRSAWAIGPSVRVR